MQIDAMRQNGIEQIFYYQCLGFLLLILSYTFFVVAAVSQPPDTPDNAFANLTMFSMDKASGVCCVHVLVYTFLVSAEIFTQ
jgi:hypothetical protein